MTVVLFAAFERSGDVLFTGRTEGPLEVRRRLFGEHRTDPPRRMTLANFRTASSTALVGLVRPYLPGHASRVGSSPTLFALQFHSSFRNGESKRSKISSRSPNNYHPPRSSPEVPR